MDTSKNSKTQTQGAMSMLDLSSLINDYVKTLDEVKSQLREQRQMVKDTFENDQEYHELSEKVKVLNKSKTAVKQKLLKTPAAEAALVKMQDLQTEMRDMEEKLSSYLQEYQRVSGTNMIEGYDGAIREIVPVYRLVKKNNKYNP